MKVFYSWQKDRPAEANLSFIEAALKKAIKRLVNEPGSVLVPALDRDMSGLTGAPDIARAIFWKIRDSDAFVCDVTLVGTTARGNGTPNPNVLAELGYAVGVLGWDRVVMVANTAFGPAEKLPFDLRGRRVYCYSALSTDESLPTARNGLARDLRGALKEIGTRGREKALPPTLRELLAEKGDIRRQRDREALRDTFRCLPDVVLTHHFQTAAYGWFSGEDVWFYEGFNGLVNSASFDFYDPLLKAKVDEFHEAWTNMLGYTHLYSHDGRKTQFSLGEAGHRNPAWAAREREKWDAFVSRASSGYNALVAFTRENYPEIDLDALARQALEDRRKRTERLERLLGDVE